MGDIRRPSQHRADVPWTDGSAAANATRCELPRRAQCFEDWDVDSGYATVGRVRLHYVSRGSGPLVLLLHGFPECWYSWRHQLAALGDRYRVVAPDLRGYNRSDKPLRVRDYRLQHLVADVVGLIHHFGAREAAIIGHDWGAGIAWTLAEQAPQCVWKLAALQVPPLMMWWRNLTLQQVLRSWYMLGLRVPWLPERLLALSDSALLERVMRHTTVRPGTFTEEDFKIYHEAWRQRGALTATVNYYRANLFPLIWDSRRQARSPTRKLRTPTLFIYGEQDVAVAPATVRRIGDYVAGPYREVRIPDAGHWVQNEAPDLVSMALRQFLDAP